MNNYETTYCEISVNKENKAIIIKWKGYSPSADYRESMLMALEIAKSQNCINLLGDTTKFRTMVNEDVEWTNENWSREAIKIGIIKVAVLIPENIVQKNALEKNIRESIPTRMVASLEEAFAWFRE